MEKLICSVSGIRGKVGKTLTFSEAYKTTLYFYKEYLKEKRYCGEIKIILGKDDKKSGNALILGIKEAIEDIIKRKIDHEQLKQEGYPKKTVNGALDWKYYIQNPDRSITITLLLYEHNQVLLLLTFIITVISGISLFILILLMVFKKYFSPKNLVPYNDK